jgi:hypothetical protein
MKQLRKEDLSFHHYLRFNVLNEYIEEDTAVPLVYSATLSTAGSNVYEAQSTRSPSPTSLGRGWVYMDAYGDTTEQTTMVTVYDASSAVISGTDYLIDYIDGRIVTSGVVVPAKVTYKYFYVSLVNDWEDVHVADVPVISVLFDDYEKQGFQLGGGQYIPRRCHLQIFASDQAERDDLLEMVFDGLHQKCCPNQNWTHGTIIDWNGTFNEDYTYELVQYRSSLHFENMKGRIIYPPLLRMTTSDYTMLSDLNRYRARIDFDLYHYKEY